jgi:mRNA-degrading endonuclease RelE of RelBE toxin-antitoxin system
MVYSVEFAESVKEQLRALPARQRALLLDSIEQQLVHEPLTETRNRKPLRPNPIAPWELRVGNLRVFYDVVAEEPNIVRVLAIGEKKGYAKEFGDEVIVLTSYRKPVAAIVSLSKVDKESLSLSMSPEFMEIIEKARAEFATGKTLTLEEMKREILG